MSEAKIDPVKRLEYVGGGGAGVDDEAINHGLATVAGTCQSCTSQPYSVPI
jgi:hypothetical protein